MRTRKHHDGRKLFKQKRIPRSRGDRVMTKLKDQMVRLIQQDAAEKMGAYATDLIRAAPEEKEQILAGLEFERWLEQACRESLL